MVRRGLPAILAAVLAASLCGCLLAAVSGPSRAGALVSAFALLAAAALAVGCTAVRGWRDRTCRPSWLLLSAATAAEVVWLAGALLPAFAGQALHAQPSGDVGHLVAVPFLIAALLLLPSRMHDRSARARTALDVVAAAFAYGALT
jgi:hypothetical protein